LFEKGAHAASPDRVFDGKVSYIYPTLNAQTRTVPVRIELPNVAGLLRPGMYANAELYSAVMEGAVERVRPKMMTVVAIMAGLLPIMWSVGAGSEVMRRIAAPMVGGMVSSTLLTLIVIPPSMRWSRSSGWPRRAEAGAWRTRCRGCSRR